MAKAKKGEGAATRAGGGAAGAAGGGGGDEAGFEQQLGRLEEIVERMEQGDLPLEEAMGLFEEGVKLGQACQKRLDEAERRITMLIEKASGEIVEEPFDPETAARAESPKPSAGRKSSASASSPARPASAPAPGRQSSFADDAGPDDIPF